MNENMFIALMNALIVLGQKEVRTKEEVLAYGNFLGYAGSVARYNRLCVEEEIDRKLEPEGERWPDAPRRANPAARVA
jgi:hypothetical protein